MKVRPIDRDNLKEIAGRLVDLADKDSEFCHELCDTLNRLLDDLLADDIFGTEGQLDPRGDHRD